MQTIKIQKLELENFKCHQHLVVHLGGKNASIYGDNATGKTSIYDALTWLLFGKDSAGNGEKNVEIKPLDESGQVKDHDALTAVTAEILVNGQKMTLRRTYREVWSTKRGSSQATYDGNTSEYYVDGVPCKKNAFQDQVNELVTEDTFRMLTSVTHFADGISWQDRRAVLFQIAGVMDDRQILTTTDAFASLLDGMGKHTIEDYKKKLLFEKKKFVGAKTEIPARISECQKTIEDVSALDFAGAKAELEILNAKKESLAAQLLAVEHDSATDSKRMEIREAQLDLTALENENKAYRASQATVGVNVHSLNIRMAALQSQVTRKKRELENEVAYISGLDKKIEDARNRWIAVNGETFTGGNCISCGQPLPAAKLQEVRDSFEANKKKNLDSILKDANSFKEIKAQAEARITASMDEVSRLDSEMKDLQSQITDAEANMVEIKDLSHYAGRKTAIESRIKALSDELANMVNGSADLKTALNKQISEMNLNITTCQSVIGKESLLEYSRQRIAGLREDAKNAAECLEAIEKMLYLIDEYSRYKTRFVEDSINGLFRIARFRLFREQANGGIEERCDVVYDGVPYISVNNGMKINLGIDIINTLSQAYGVLVPLFVDNAESVTNLEQYGSQIIRLVVSEKDKELRIENED